jgi:hypothetical protein
MNKDERIRNQLGTVMSAAVRLGMTSSGMSREALAAEVRDLVELALHVTAHVPGELSADGKNYLAWQKAEGERQELFWRNALTPTVPADPLAHHRPSVADIVAADGGVPGLAWPDGADGAGARRLDPLCGVRVPAYGAGMEHDHICEKAPGHADGPGGSDHLCDVCGQLFTVDASTPDDDVEIEL